MSGSESPNGSGLSVVSFASADLPARDRIPIFREFIGRKLMRVEIEQHPDHPFCANATVRRWPGLDYISARRSPLTVGRTRALLSDGDDRLVFQLDDYPSLVSSRSGEVPVGVGDAILTSNSDAVSRTFPSTGELASLFLTRGALSPLLRGGEGSIGRVIPANTPVLKLIRTVLTILSEDAVSATSEVQTLTINYVYDLVAVALGATRDAAAQANERGVPAALLRSIKAYLEEQLARGDLSPERLAPRYGMSARSIQRLFEREGTTFTDFLRERRLDRAHRMLITRRFDQMSILDVALACGFGDLSHFYRLFRARYGMTPRDLRVTNR